MIFIIYWYISFFSYVSLYNLNYRYMPLFSNRYSSIYCYISIYIYIKNFLMMLILLLLIVVYSKAKVEIVSNYKLFIQLIENSIKKHIKTLSRSSANPK